MKRFVIVFVILLGGCMTTREQSPLYRLAEHGIDWQAVDSIYAHGALRIVITREGTVKVVQADLTVDEASRIFEHQK